MKEEQTELGPILLALAAAIKMKAEKMEQEQAEREKMEQEQADRWAKVSIWMLEEHEKEMAAQEKAERKEEDKKKANRQVKVFVWLVIVVAALIMLIEDCVSG